jgi:hypothetical protein
VTPSRSVDDASALQALRFERDEPPIHLAVLNIVRPQGYAAESTRPSSFSDGSSVDPAAATARANSAEARLLRRPAHLLGVDYNAHVIESILKYVAPELRWR